MGGVPMFPAAAAQASPVIAPPGLPLDQPSAYSPIPQRLITDLHDNPLAIGLYGFVARLYLVAQTPIPLSVPDVLRYDPTLSRGAVLRAFARLLAGGYVIEAAQPGRKTRYTPAWGRVGGAVLPWNMGQPCLGRPRHVARLRLDRRLFDICMGKLTPHTTRAAVITRYVTTPVLSLADVGCYALTLSGLPRATPALLRLGAVRDGIARPLPSDERLLALISQRALDLGEQTDIGTELTISGTRKLGVTPLLAPDPAAATAQPLFFVPPGMIGSLIRPMIGSMIGSDAANTTAATATGTDEMRSDGRNNRITWESRDPRDAAIPPPPPCDEVSGGGAKAFVLKATAQRRQEIQSLPDTETVAVLQAINVKPAQIVELAQIPLATVEAAIADGRARPGVRDLAGWVVSLLRAHRDYGWKIMPPAPAPESPEALRAAFVRYAAEQEAARSLETDHVEQLCVAECTEEQECTPRGSASPSLTQLWNDVQADMRMRITRQEFMTWIRPAVLRSVEDGMAIISAPSVRVKDGLERYTASLRELLSSLLDMHIQVRMTIHGEVPSAQGQTTAAGVDATTTEAQAPATAPKALASPAPDHRPHWISAEQWVTLPAVLRAALIGSTVANGTIQTISPHLARLIEMRYAREVATLIVAAESGSCPVDGALATSAKAHGPPLTVEDACGKAVTRVTL
jgi:DnaA N-terminal domain